MKKVLAIILALALAFCFAACGEKQEEQKQESVLDIKEVKDVTVPEFKVKVCGAKVSNKDMAAYPIYQITANTVNSSGTAHSNVYIGYLFTDVLEAAQVTGNLGKATITCTDGYEVTFEGDIKAEGVLLAISKDGTQFKEGPWFAPCTSKTTGDYAQDLSKLEIEGGTSPLASGSGSEDEKGGESAGPTELAEPVVKDKTSKITFADYSFKINGKDVKGADLDGLTIWNITVTVQNSKGTISEAAYSGYALKDVLSKLGISGSKVTAIASDGYTSEVSAENLASDLTIIAIEKDKKTSDNGSVWLAPCSETTSGRYAKDVVEFKVE